MKQALLRFYEELNEYLPEDKRKRSFVCRFEGSVSVALLLQAVGVPLAVIDLILRNGESVGGASLIRDGDRISCFPVFESFDIHGITRMREEPLRRPSFVVASCLARLAAYLRLLGFDAQAVTGQTVEEAVRIAEAGSRILLTRDDAAASCASRAYRVRGSKPRQQAAEVLARLNLHRLVAPFTRCPRCNDALSESGGSLRCACCGKNYKEGVHLRRIQRLVERLIAEGCPSDPCESV